MVTVDFVDSRPAWMKKEDETAACFFHCSMYKNCSSKFGTRCNQLGGNEIPKLQTKKCTQYRIYK